MQSLSLPSWIIQDTILVNKNVARTKKKLTLVILWRNAKRRHNTDKTLAEEKEEEGSKAEASVVYYT